jgi:hypothetical protein
MEEPPKAEWERFFDFLVRWRERVGAVAFWVVAVIVVLVVLNAVAGLGRVVLLLGAGVCLVLGAIMWKRGESLSTSNDPASQTIQAWAWEQTCESMLVRGEVCAVLKLKSRHGETAQRVTCAVTRGGRSFSHQTWGGSFLGLGSDNRQSSWSAPYPIEFSSDEKGGPEPRLFKGDFDVRWTAWEPDPNGIGIEGKEVTLFEGPFTWPCEVAVDMRKEFDSDLKPQAASPSSSRGQGDDPLESRFETRQKERPREDYTDDEWQDHLEALASRNPGAREGQALLRRALRTKTLSIAGDLHKTLSEWGARKLSLVGETQVTVADRVFMAQYHETAHGVVIQVIEEIGYGLGLRDAELEKIYKRPDTPADERDRAAT